MQATYAPQIQPLKDQYGYCYGSQSCHDLIVAEGTAVANLHQARDLAISALDQSRALASVSRLQAYELAHAALSRQLAEAVAAHAHWEKEPQRRSVFPERGICGILPAGGE